MKDIQTTTGCLIAFYRRNINIKQDKLAFELNISQSKVSDWENDKVSPSVDELVLLADVLKIHPAQLIPQYNIHFHPEFKDTAVNNWNLNNVAAINNPENGLQEERNAYKEALKAKDEALKAKDETIAELRKNRI